MSKTDKSDKSDDKQVAAPTRTGSAAEKAGNTVRDAANKNGHAAREVATSGSDVVREVAEASHEAARDAAEKGHAVARDVVEQTVSAVEQSTEQSMAAFATATDYASFWRELATAQLAYHVDAVQKLVAARSWPEQLAIQQGYLQGNVERLVEATSRFMTLTDSRLGQRQQRPGDVAERRARA